MEVPLKPVEEIRADPVSRNDEESSSTTSSASGTSSSASSNKSKNAVEDSLTENIVDTNVGSVADGIERKTTEAERPNSAASTHTFTKPGSASSRQSENMVASTSQAPENLGSTTQSAKSVAGNEKRSSAVSQTFERHSSALSRSSGYQEVPAQCPEGSNVGNSQSIELERVGNVPSNNSSRQGSAASHDSNKATGANLTEKPTSSTSNNSNTATSSTESSGSTTSDSESTDKSRSPIPGGQPVEKVSSSRSAGKPLSAPSRVSGKSGSDTSDNSGSATSKLGESNEKLNGSSPSTGKTPNGVLKQVSNVPPTEPVNDTFEKTSGVVPLNTASVDIREKNLLQRTGMPFDTGSSDVDEVKRFIINEKRQSASENINKMVDSYVNENQLFNGQVISFKNDIKDAVNKTEDVFKDF